MPTNRNCLPKVSYFALIFHCARQLVPQNFICIIQGNDNDALSDIVIGLERNYQQGAVAENQVPQVACPTQATDSSYNSAKNSQTNSQKEGQ